MKREFKRFWRDNAQYIFMFFFISIFIIPVIFICLLNKNLKEFLLVSGIELVWMLMCLDLLLQNHHWTDIITMDGNGITLRRKENVLTHIKWDDVVEISCGRYCKDRGYHYTYVIWDSCGQQIWFQKGDMVKEYMIEIYPPIEKLIPE